MSALTTDFTSANPKGRFPSFSALRAAYTNLLKRHRKEDGNPELFSEINNFIIQGRETGAVIDNDDDRLAAQSLLDYWVSVLLRDGYPAPDSDLAEFDITLAPELDEADCPYLGLDAFQEKDASLFYGRQRLVAQLIASLTSNSFLAVIGPSGSGKSSVVRGGLIPKLKAGALPNSDQWYYFSPMVPGSTPLENLVRTLAPNSGADADWVQTQMHQLEAGSVSLPALIRQRGGEQPTVLVIDQFEEVFTLCPETIRDGFINHLVALVQATAAPQHYLILTMRSDFETQVAKLPQFLPLFEANLVRVLPLDAGELREAIEAPAEQVGLKFEAGVVDQLVTDVLGEPAALPLLQFMLLQLWKHRERNRVTYHAYQKLGGARQAIAQSADDLYNHLIPQDQETAKRILLKMVRPSTGLEVTNNRIRQQALYQLGFDPGRIDHVLEKLCAARLVRRTPGETPDDTQIEVAHEALIRNWPRLIEWLDDERVNLRQRLRLADTAIEWQRRGYPANLLLRGGLISEAKKYDDLNELETRFIKQSSRREKTKQQIWFWGSAIIIIALSVLSGGLFMAREAEREAESMALEAENNAQNQLVASLQRELEISRQREQYQLEEFKKQLQEIQAQLPMDDVIEQQINQVQDELAKIENLISIEYFRKREDLAVIGNILNQFKEEGFDLRIIDATVVRNQPTNAIWFGKDVPVEDVKRLARDLIDGGVEIRSIIFKDNWPDHRSRLIQLGGNYVGTCDRDWQIEDIDRITSIKDFPLSSQDISVGCAALVD